MYKFVEYVLYKAPPIITIGTMATVCSNIENTSRNYGNYVW